MKKKKKKKKKKRNQAARTFRYSSFTFRLIGVNIANGIFNINAPNNVITIFETTATSNTIITLPIGYYTGSTLATQIATSFTSSSKVSNTYTCSFSQTTFYLTITANTKTFNFVNTSFLLGMMNNTTASLTQTSTQGLKLLIDFIVVKTNICSSFVSTSQNFNSGTFYIPLNNINNGYVGYIGRNQLPCVIRDFDSNINRFNVTLYDPYNNPVSLNNYDWSMILELF